MFKGPQVQKQVSQSYVFCVLHHDLGCFTFLRNFKIISQIVFNLQSGHEYSYMVKTGMFHVQRAITPKRAKSELRVMCSARRLIPLTEGIT